MTGFVKVASTYSSIRQLTASTIKVINYIKKQYKQKNPVTQRMTGFVKVASTYSSTLKRAVPSALVGLTSLFGMGRGGPHCYRHLKSLNNVLNALFAYKRYILNHHS